MQNQLAASSVYHAERTARRVLSVERERSRYEQFGREVATLLDNAPEWTSDTFARIAEFAQRLGVNLSDNEANEGRKGS